MNIIGFCFYSVSYIVIERTFPPLDKQLTFCKLDYRLSLMVLNFINPSYYVEKISLLQNTGWKIPSLKNFFNVWNKRLKFWNLFFHQINVLRNMVSKHILQIHLFSVTNSSCINIYHWLVLYLRLFEDTIPLDCGW